MDIKKQKLIIVIFISTFWLLSNVSAIPEVSIGTLSESNIPTVEVNPPPEDIAVSIWLNFSSPGDIPHNELGSLQGGVANEYYHLNQSVFNYLMANIFDWITSFFALNPFDQSLNTTDDVTFNNITSTGNLIVDGSVGIGTSTPQNTLNIIGDFNQSNGNSTFNMIYGEMWNHTDVGFVVDLITVRVYENVTNLTDGSQNGFTLSNSKLTTQLSGFYRVDYSISFSGSANSEIGFSVGIGGVEQNQTHSHRTLGTGGDIGNTGGTGYIFLNQGDVVTLMARDEASPVKDINIIAANLNLMRIGN